jgi:hypothetical protein
MHAEMAMNHAAELKRWHALPEKDRRKTPRPAEPQWRISEDYTTESLQRVLAETQRGVLLLRDEIAGVFEFDRYHVGSAASHRGFFLQSYEGEEYTIHRIARGTLFIKNNALSMYGNIQPARLAEFDGLERDGMLQRLTPVRIISVPEPRPDVGVPHWDQLEGIIRRVAYAGNRIYTTGMRAARIILDVQAEGSKSAEILDYGPGFQGFSDKLHGLCARMALVLHLIDNPDQEMIPEATVQRAQRLTMHYLMQQAIGFYEAMSGTALTTRRSVAAWLLVKTPQRFVASDLTHNVRSCRGLGTKELHGVLEPLITGGWLEPIEPFQHNRAWLFDTRVPGHFAERTTAERNRRAAFHAMITKLRQKPPPP